MSETADTDIRDEIADNHLRDSELIGMFADVIKLHGLVTVLGCLCDGILLTDIRLGDELRQRNPPADAVSFQKRQSQIAIAHFLLIEALNKINAKS